MNRLIAELRQVAKEIQSKEYKPSELDMDRAYELFRDSYMKETGHAWNKDKFLRRAQNWIFFGDENGFVAIRKQRSGLVKLVGAAGHPKSVLKGFTELLSKNYPLWGMMSEKLAGYAERSGLKRPPAMLIKKLMPLIGPSVFGGTNFKVHDDGGVTFVYEDVGAAKKYFVGTKQYFKTVLKLAMKGAYDISMKEKLGVIKLIKDLL